MVQEGLQVEWLLSCVAGFKIAYFLKAGLPG